MTGALCALDEVEGFDPRMAEFMVGTSAGAVLAALLGAGISPQDLHDHQLGIPVEGWELEYDHDSRSGGSHRPGPPRLGIGSRSLLWRTVSHPMAVTPMAAMSAVLPRGRGTLAPVSALVESVVPAGSWVEHSATWVVAMDYDSGRRMPFGRPGAPPAGLSDAVTASCAIPGWYAPIEIAGRRYIDGGACSSTSADLLAGLDLDEVYVLAPMASFVMDHPHAVMERLERSWRRQVTRRMEREAAKVRDSGTDVTMIAPGPRDLEAMGANMMNPARRQLVLETSLDTTAEALRVGASGSERVTVGQPDDLLPTG
jgi:NTE family protein